MTGASTRLAVQSPRRLVRDALCAYLAGWPEFAVVGQTAELDALYALCALRQPDTVLVDADRLAVETVTELRRLRTAFPSVQVVVMYSEFGPHALAAAVQADITALVPGNRGLSGLLRALRVGAGTPHRPGPASEPPRRPRVEPGRPPLVTVRGPAGVTLDDVTTVLVEAGLPFVFAATPQLDDREHWFLWHRGPRPVLLIDPRPADWTFAEALDGPAIVVWSIQPDLADVVDALLRGVRGLVRPADVPTELAPVVSLVSQGYVALPAMHFDELAQPRVGRLRDRPGGVPELTARERDILDSIACGHTVRQTAR